MAEPKLHAARLIPVSGVDSKKEAEQRATSALLAILTVVRDLSTELLAPLGASRAARAAVESYIEVSFPGTGPKIRPDGLIRVSYGKNSWSALVEVKTGDDNLGAEQVNSYWDLARENGIDHVLTISNEIAPKEGIHPTVGLKVKANSKVGVSHLSWTAIASKATQLAQHKGVSDPEQAYLLNELLRYLEHPNSGALRFQDMGPHWVAVRDAAREGTLTRKSEGVEDICARWDQLINFAALRLTAETGGDVQPIFSKAQSDPRARRNHLIDTLTTKGSLSGTLRIPNAASDLTIEADLKARQFAVAMEVAAPLDKGAKARVTWLVNQLPDARGDLMVEAFAKGRHLPTFATLDQCREDRFAPLGSEKREPVRFRLIARKEMGMPRKSGGRSPGFIDSALTGIHDFYRTVGQQITSWRPPAPRLTEPPKMQETDLPLKGEDFDA